MNFSWRWVVFIDPSFHPSSLHNSCWRSSTVLRKQVCGIWCRKLKESVSVLFNSWNWTASCKATFCSKKYCRAFVTPLWKAKYLIGKNITSEEYGLVLYQLVLSLYISSYWYSYWCRLKVVFQENSYSTTIIQKHMTNVFPNPINFGLWQTLLSTILPIQ